MVHNESKTSDMNFPSIKIFNQLYYDIHKIMHLTYYSLSISFFLFCIQLMINPSDFLVKGREGGLNRDVPDPLVNYHIINHWTKPGSIEFILSLFFICIIYNLKVNIIWHEFYNKKLRARVVSSLENGKFIITPRDIGLVWLVEKL